MVEILISQIQIVKTNLSILFSFFTEIKQNRCMDTTILQNGRINMKLLCKKNKTDKHNTWNPTEHMSVEMVLIIDELFQELFVPLTNIAPVIHITGIQFHLQLTLFTTILLDSILISNLSLPRSNSKSLIINIRKLSPQMNHPYYCIKTLTPTTQQKKRRVNCTWRDCVLDSVCIICHAAIVYRTLLVSIYLVLSLLINVGGLFLNVNNIWNVCCYCWHHVMIIYETSELSRSNICESNSHTQSWINTNYSANDIFGNLRSYSVLNWYTVVDWLLMSLFSSWRFPSVSSPIFPRGKISDTYYSQEDVIQILLKMMKMSKIWHNLWLW